MQATTTEAIQPNDNHFFQEKPKHEKDYIVACGEILIKNGMRQQVEEVYIRCPSILNAKGRVASAQRWVLDRYWRDQFLLLENTTTPKVDTFDVRQYLVMGGEHEAWLSNFEKFIVPFVIHHNLPKVLPAGF